MVTTVVHVITGLEQGGAEGVLLRLVRAQVERMRVAVVSLTTEGVHGAALRQAGADVLALGMPRGSLRPGALIRLFRYLRRARPDVVQTWMYHADLLGGVIARLAGCRTVVWSLRNSSLDPRSSSRATRLVMWACAALSRIVPAAIVSCSQAAARLHQRFGYAPEKFSLVPNGYDLERFAPDPATGHQLRQRLGLAPDAPVLGCVARWDPQKDHATLLEALATVATEHQDLRLLLVGAGMEESNQPLATLIDRFGVRQQVMLLGARTDVQEIMVAFDWHVLSSASGEAFPNAVAETMACGVPNIVTDVGDAALIVGECGVVVPPRDADALAAAIGAAVAAGDSERRARGRCSRQRVESEFGLAAMVAGYECVWERACALAGR